MERRDKHSGRAFTRDEIKKLLALASDEWKTAIAIGLYTGLRLTDVVSLRWSNVDLAMRELTVKTAKTGRVVILPIGDPLLKRIRSLLASDDPQAPLMPGLEEKPPSWLSNSFYDLMAAAGLVKPRTHQANEEGRGRSARRQLSPISFHALRHTAASLLKNTGVSDVVARDIIGHESEAVSRQYTHIEMETKRAAVKKLPDLL